MEKEFKLAEENFKKHLEISRLDAWIDPDHKLLEYILPIINYFNLRLLDFRTLKDKVLEVIRLYEYGNDKIVSGATLDLMRKLKVDLGNKDLFIFAWTSLMSPLYLRLNVQYRHLMTDGSEAHICHGQDTKSYESWTSGVFPEDEEFDRENHNRSNSVWRTEGDVCCSCMRR